MAKMNIKKGDKVKVLSGKDRGAERRRYRLSAPGTARHR